MISKRLSSSTVSVSSRSLSLSLSLFLCSVLTSSLKSLYAYICFFFQNFHPHPSYLPFVLLCRLWNCSADQRSHQTWTNHRHNKTTLSHNLDLRQMARPKISLIRKMSPVNPKGKTAATKVKRKHLRTRITGSKVCRTRTKNWPEISRECQRACPYRDPEDSNRKVNSDDPSQMTSTMVGRQLPVVKPEEQKHLEIYLLILHPVLRSRTTVQRRRIIGTSQGQTASGKWSSVRRQTASTLPYDVAINSRTILFSPTVNTVRVESIISVNSYEDFLHIPLSKITVHVARRFCPDRFLCVCVI